MISADSQIYYDLNIYGDDFYELVRWMHEDFGVQTMSDFESYAPLESPFHLLRVIGRKILGLAEPRYCSLKVIDISKIIIEGKWP